MIPEVEVEVETHIIDGNFRVVTFLKYYPIRFEVVQNYEQNRREVYNFKKGRISPLALKLFQIAIRRLKTVKPSFDFWVCGVPASKIEVHKERFESFCSNVASICKINNGYNLLVSCKDRDAVHMAGAKDYSKILECIEFGNVVGKDIILCDDVMTKGTSFRIIATHLKKLGARSVTGIILAKTHWIDE